MSHLYYSLSSCFFILTLKILCMGPKCDSGTWEGRAGKFEASLVYIMSSKPSRVIQSPQEGREGGGGREKGKEKKSLLTSTFS